MNTISLEETKSLQLDILLAFDEFCKKNELSYWLIYGTLLGAVRHEGFIPWDDDIDVVMPYGDYRRFIDIVNEMGTGGMMTQRYRVADYFIDSPIPYHQIFTKIYDTRTIATKSTLSRSLGFKEGIFIDVFALKGVPEDAETWKAQQEQLQYLADKVFYATESLANIGINHPRTLLKHATAKAASLRKPYREWIAAFKELESGLPDPHPSRKTVEAASSCYSMYAKGFVYPAAEWLPTLRVPFEGHDLPVPHCYDALLRTNYGNYMELPPEDKRKPSHTQDFIFCE
ncbi:LicD family protein [Arabiibacter massiliensis]|uniref:LicD family protein n=1 Tax=Arabiibacter massiliensis TaxID=1870985 RepID=UPI0009BB3015|nr:LicD family protein [Arabiibacter massiliensis]